MIGEHETAHSVVRLDIWRPACECDLDRRWAPGDEVCQLSFSDAQE